MTSTAISGKSMTMRKNRSLVIMRVVSSVAAVTVAVREERPFLRFFRSPMKSAPFEEYLEALEDVDLVVTLDSCTAGCNGTCAGGGVVITTCKDLDDDHICTGADLEVQRETVCVDYDPYS